MKILCTPVEVCVFNASIIKILSLNRITPLKISAIPLTEVALEMIKANISVIFIPKWTLEAFPISKQICAKSIGVNSLKRTHYLAIRTADAPKKYINDFIVNFADEFKN